MHAAPELTVQSFERLLEFDAVRAAAKIAPRAYCIVQLSARDVLHPNQPIQEAFRLAGEPKQMVSIPINQLDGYKPEGRPNHRRRDRFLRPIPAIGMSFDYIIVGRGLRGMRAGGTAVGERPTQCAVARGGADGPSSADPHAAGARYGQVVLRSTPRLVAPDAAEGDTPSETWIRGKVLGGSSAVNGMMYFRGHPEDYDGWARQGCSGWGWQRIRLRVRVIENTAR